MAGRIVTVVLALGVAGCAQVACDAPAATGVSETRAESGLPTAPVRVEGERFEVELAYEPDAIVKGLGGRESIDERGGMLFVFPRAAARSFVMRDCVVPIDIAYLDPAGRVVSMHTMAPEPARGPEESASEYENRLKKYPSRYRAQFVLEVAGGTFERLGLEVGERVEFDVDALKRLAR